MLCDECGNENPVDNRFCGHCGSKLMTKEAASPDAFHLPSGIRRVSSMFRREVEQQQVRLQQLKEQGPAGTYSELASSRLASNDVTHDPQFETESLPDRTSSDVPAPERYAHVEPTPEAPEPPHMEPPISGPSFLGLNGPDPESSSDLRYLYEDEPSGAGTARKVVAALIALVFLAFIVYEWKQNPNWQTAIIGRHRNQPATTASAPAPQATPGTPQDNQSSATTNTSNSGPNAPQNNTAANVPPPAPSQAPVAGDASGPAADSSRSQNDNSSKATGGDRGKNLSGGQSANDKSAASDHSGEAPASSAAVATSGTADTGSANSKGEPGEQAAADNENATGDTSNDDAAEEPASSKERSSAVKPTRPRYSASDEPDNQLVTKADAYLYGRGVRKNCDQALVYLRTAANRGNANARSKLGGLYATGHCVPLDRAEAYNWFTLARDAGTHSVWVQRNLTMLWSEMSPDEKARALQPHR